MPGFDRTGPRGEGPMTGGGFGTCAGYPAPDYAPWGGRRAFGGLRGVWGRGRGYRNRYYATGLPFWARGGYVPQPPIATRGQEAEMLANEANLLRQELESIEARIAELREKPESDK